MPNAAPLCRCRGGGGARLRRAHGVLVVLDDEDRGKRPQRGHVERLVDLALVSRAVAEIGEGDAVAAEIPVGEGESRAERHVGADDSVAAVEFALEAEHVHRAALALGMAADPAGEFGHHPVRIHAAGEHVAVVAVGGDAPVAFLGACLEADDDGLLADVEVAEPPDQPHSVELARLLLEPADQEHVPVVGHELLSRQVRLFRLGRLSCPALRGRHDCSSWAPIV